jgi:hypothetical protein
MQHKSFKRAERRHEVKRLRNNRKSYHGYAKNFPDDLNRFLGMVVSTAKNYSCHMCGNPRKFLGNGTAAMTIREQSDLEVIELS